MTYYCKCKVHVLSAFLPVGFVHVYAPVCPLSREVNFLAYLFTVTVVLGRLILCRKCCPSTSVLLCNQFVWQSIQWTHKHCQWDRMACGKLCMYADEFVHNKVTASVPHHDHTRTRVQWVSPFSSVSITTSQWKKIVEKKDSGSKTEAEQIWTTVELSPCSVQAWQHFRPINLNTNRMVDVARTTASKSEKTDAIGPLSCIEWTSRQPFGQRNSETNLTQQIEQKNN